MFLIPTILGSADLKILAPEGEMFSLGDVTMIELEAETPTQPLWAPYATLGLLCLNRQRKVIHPDY